MKSIFSLLFISLVILGCTKNNQDPAWIEIAEWDLQSNPSSVNDPGILTSNFSDAWIYMDGDLVGVFELPVKLPIIKERGNIVIRKLISLIFEKFAFL